MKKYINYLFPAILVLPLLGGCNQQKTDDKQAEITSLHNQLDELKKQKPDEDKKKQNRNKEQDLRHPVIPVEQAFLRKENQLLYPPENKDHP